jgi:hypothetical protein
MPEKHRISALFDEYKTKKQNALAWIFCFIYSFDTMVDDGVCHPSTSFLAAAGDTPKSRATIKRYLAILESMDLIERSYPDGRKHILHATEKGRNLYNGRATKKKCLWITCGQPVDNFPIEPLINKQPNTINKLNSKDLKRRGGNQKPKLTLQNLRILNIMVKKCTHSVGECDRISSEIVHSIVKGALMCEKGTGTYHSIPNAINIAIWLIKQGRWKTPKDFDDTAIREVERMAKQENIKCSVCGEPGKAVSGVDGKKHFFCEEHYFAEFDKVETEGMKRLLWKGANREFDENTKGKSRLKGHRFLNYRGLITSPDKYTTKTKFGCHLIKENSSGKWAAFSKMDFLLAMVKVENFIRGRHKTLKTSKVIKI